MIRQTARRDDPALDVVGLDLLAAAHRVVDADANDEAAPALDPSVRAQMIKLIAATHKVSAADLARRTDSFVAAYLIAMHNRVASKLK